MSNEPANANDIDTSIPGWDDLDDDLEDVPKITTGHFSLYQSIRRKPNRGHSQTHRRTRKQDRLSLANFKDDELLLAVEAAQVLGISVKTLANWRWKGAGPSFNKIGGAIRYQVADLKSFIETRQRTSTSQETEK